MKPDVIQESLKMARVATNLAGIPLRSGLRSAGHFADKVMSSALNSDVARDVLGAQMAKEMRRKTLEGQHVSQI